MLQISHIYKTYPGPIHALANISFALNSGELKYLIGHSGAGKTTLFNIINGFDEPTSGQVLFESQNIFQMNPNQMQFMRRKVGIIFQDFNLLENKTIFENLALPLLFKKESPHLIKTKIEDLCERLNLTLVLNNFPHQLSGGEKQRAAIARTVLLDPILILADEPTGSLDPNTSEEIFKLFFEIKNRGSAILIATHNYDLIRKFPAPTLELKKGQLLNKYEDSSCILNLS